MGHELIGAYTVGILMNSANTNTYLLTISNFTDCTCMIIPYANVVQGYWTLLYIGHQCHAITLLKSDLLIGCSPNQPLNDRSLCPIHRRNDVSHSLDHCVSTMKLEVVNLATHLQKSNNLILRRERGQI